MFTLIGSNGVLEVYGDADEHEVGQEGLVEPVGPLVDSEPLAEAFGEVPPRGSRPAHPQQGVGHGVVVHDHVAPLARITSEILRTLIWPWDRGMARVLCTIFSRQT